MFTVVLARIKKAFNYFVAHYIAILSVVVLLSMALATVGAITLRHWINTSVNLSEDKILVVNKGDSLSKVAYQLERENVLSSAKLFILYARFQKKTKLEVGEYQLVKNSSHDGLLNTLYEANVITYNVTLVEGKTFKDFIQVLQKKENITSLIDPSQSHDAILGQIGVDVDHPEGWFFPDTYRYVAGISDVELLQQAHQRMQSVLAEEWSARVDDLPYQSAYEALTMASIIEKETGVPYERPEIAGVFVRRLNIGMRLQTDPTIIYGLGDEYQGNIRRKHLRQKTPYNTYMIDGLPPTPIAMPGREAIHAALHPKEGDALYFVAKGDGSHYFSKTLREHNNAVREYQIKKRKANYQSAPQP